MALDQVDHWEPPEAPGIATRTVLLFILGLFAFASLTGAGLYVYYEWSLSGPIVPPTSRFPEPRLQVDPQADLTALLDRRAVALTSYGWVDKEAGLVRIPIRRAMEMVVARGAQALGPVDAPEAVPSPARPAPPRLGGAGGGNRNVARDVR